MMEKENLLDHFNDKANPKRYTLIFCLDKIADKVLLIRKLRGLGKGKINGPGGKIEPGETPKDGAIRELKEETGVTAKSAEFCGTVKLSSVSGWLPNMVIYVYRSYEFDGTPVTTDEAEPLWFGVDNIPYAQMWPDDIHWYKYVLKGDEQFQVEGVFGESEGDLRELAVKTSGTGEVVSLVGQP